VIPPLCQPIPSAWAVLPPRPEQAAEGAVSVDDELDRLDRLEVYAANLWAVTRRLVEWECGEGPSAARLLPSQQREAQAQVDAYRARVERLLDPDAPQTFVWSPGLEKCEAQPDLFDCQRECLVRPERSWCDATE